MNRWTLGWLLIGILWLPGCPETEPGPYAPTLSKVVLIDEEAEKQRKKEALDKAMKKERRPILIGGCRDLCKDAEVGFRSYMDALRTEGPSASIPFLETSEMVWNGERRGDEWVRQWKDGRLKERAASIGEFAVEIGEWVKKTSPEALEAALAEGVVMDEDDRPGRLVRFRHPPIEGDASAPVWTYRVQARGWEWLISAIDTKE